MAEPFVTKIDQSQATRLQQELVSRGYTITKPQYTLFQAKSKDVSVTLYASLKLVVQGKGMGDFIEFYLEPDLLQKFVYTHKKILSPLEHDITPKIGSDEAGKGDFFGPLVIASVYSRGEEDISWLIESKVKDSKCIQEKPLLKLAKAIELRLSHEIIIIRPQKYNPLYSSFSNLNHLLAWCHAEAISSLAKKVDAKKILVDKFACETVLEQALSKKNIDKRGPIAIEQRVRAEEDIVVAAASILARAHFLREMENLSIKMGMSLPRGASAQVIVAGKNLVRKYSPEILQECAKWHFSTTQKVLQI